MVCGSLVDRPFGPSRSAAEGLASVPGYRVQNALVKPLTISTLADCAGVGVETIRFYERKGLVRRPPRPGTGFRVYPEDAVARIRFIRQAQALGFTLQEIGGLLALRVTPGTDCAAVRSRAVSKLANVEARLAELSASAARSRSSSPRAPAAARSRPAPSSRRSPRPASRLPAGTAPKRTENEHEVARAEDPRHALRRLRRDDRGAARAASPVSREQASPTPPARDRFSTTPPRPIPPGSPQRSSARATASRRIRRPLARERRRDQRDAPAADRARAVRLRRAVLDRLDAALHQADGGKACCGQGGAGRDLRPHPGNFHRFARRGRGG